MHTATLLQVNDLAVKLSGSALLEGISFSLQKGEHLAVVGPSGSGKTTLINALAGKCFANGSIHFAGDAKPAIAVITQHHQFKSLSNLSSFYYQQRFNSADSQDSSTVKEDLLSKGFSGGEIESQLEQLGMTHVAGTRLIQLSNGEHKRFQLAQALLKKPDWLLLDSPYTGLDAKARATLNHIIDSLAESGMNILLVTSEADMPSCITHVALLNAGKLRAFLPAGQINTVKQENASAVSYPLRPVNLAGWRPSSDADFSVAIKMVDTNVVYDDRKILHNINWEVKRGECWNVSGHNGSGKSTLLSLVNGDNPQAFANEIYLFDRKKGTGETIWDIKQKIGYVSPELHHYFEPGISCFQVVASGLFDTIGLFRQLNEAQKKTVEECMELLHIRQFEKRVFSRLSNGEQRCVLLARALVKNPPLLILDEPCQGLDATVSAQFIALINDICVQLNKTLIYVSHYEAEIPPCVTHTLKLEQGKIAA
ncbi:ATP-binding cassette domain-containing protein [Sediminibacterium soli]|uniref:ATP-binding cassette domain-containing protein n=1 Tax=Sediminibacterium soli TaxID=2698829 RepID=UPI001379DD3A|nr:ATP-binding cassette domain-containing protein [Sediminibacterium soli]NCI45196.1 ATP-binding cassette domain-containing protein [Sediminibacterium soli]